MKEYYKKNIIYHIIIIYPTYIKRRNIESNNVIRPSDKHFIKNIFLNLFIEIILTMIKTMIEKE